MTSGPPLGEQATLDWPTRWAQQLWWRSRPSLVSRALWPVAAAYAAASALHRWVWHSGVRQPQRLPVPVVVVGNLVAGGAGKTPTVIATVQSLRSAGWCPGVVSRGHGRQGTAVLLLTPDTGARDGGDEPVLIRRRTGVPVAVGRDRVAAGRALLEANPAVDILVSDDGLQHHRMHRDAQILVFDRRGVGNGLLLPAGPLREPMTTPPPRTVVLYNADQPSTPWPGLLARRRLGGAVALADWWAGRPAQAAVLAALAQRSQGRPVLAAAGLAEPDRFFDMLAAAGVHLQRLPLADHAAFAPLPWPADTSDVLVTEKDAVKVQPGQTGATRVWVVTLDFSLPDAGCQALLGLLPLPPSDPTPHDDR
jgi:tetraacyldisaccharide 4'-kinase